MYERSARVGGRTTTVNAWDNPALPIELGASIFVQVNHILVEATKTFQLPFSGGEGNATDVMPELGVWNGQEFVFTSSERGGWWDLAKLLWRYGYAPVKTNALMKSTVAKFMSMYEAPVFPWKSVNEAVQKVGLLETVGVTGEQYLNQNGVTNKFASEIVQAR